MSKGQFLDPPVREKIARSTYWLQSAARMPFLKVCETAIDMTYVGGLFGSFKTPAPLLCLCFRLHELRPPVSLLQEMWTQDVHKYLRVLAMVYLRIVEPTVATREVLETIMEVDYRKIRVRNATTGHFELAHVDEIAELLLTSGEFCGLPLPSLRR